MQNKYIGDPGDFAKFLLLKGLSSGSKMLGINWYLVPDDAGNDGNKKLKESFVDIDKDLFDKLSALSLTKRIQHVEAANLFSSKTKYYREILYFKTRNEWFSNSLTTLKGSDIIFCDPDNGIEIPSCKPTNPKSVKYITLDEIKGYFDGGSSVVVYQHGSRRGTLTQQQSDRKMQLSEKLAISTDNIHVLYSGYGTPRFFFVIIQPKHKSELLSSIKSLPPFFTDMREYKH